MKLYLSFHQIPELAGLTRQRQKLVYGCAMEALFAEQPSMMSTAMRYVFGGLLCGALAGWGIASASGSSHLKLLIVTSAIVGLIAGSFSGNHVLHSRMRPYLRRVLEERKDEIAQIK